MRALYPTACAVTLRRGRRPAVERSGTNALGVRRPISAQRRGNPPPHPSVKITTIPTKFCAPIQNVKISPEVVNYAGAKIAITGNTVNTTNILSVHSSVKDAANLGSWNGIAMNNNKYDSDAVKVAGFKDMDSAITAHYEALVK